MATFGELIDRVADDLNRTDLTTQITKALNRAIEYYAKEPFWFTETSASFTLSASQAFYTSTNSNLPSDIGRIHYAEIAIAGNDSELDQMDFKRLQQANPNNSKGDPVAYSWWDSRFYTYPLAQSANVATVYYTKTYAALTVTGTSNDWTTNAPALLESYARKWLNRRVLSNFEAAAMAEQEEMQELRCLREKNEDRHRETPIEPTCF